MQIHFIVLRMYRETRYVATTAAQIIRVNIVSSVHAIGSRRWPNAVLLSAALVDLLGGVSMMSVGTMVLTVADFFRLGLTIFLVILAYARLGNPIRFLLAGRVRHRSLDDESAPEGPVVEGLETRGFRYLGIRRETLLGLPSRVAAVYAHADGRLVDLPPSGRMAGAYAMTSYENGRCALTRTGTGQDVVRDRYRSRAIGTGKTLRDLLEAHAESEAAVSLGDKPRVATSLEERLELGRRWYLDHARTELLLPAVLDGLLLGALIAFGIYLWTL